MTVLSLSMSVVQILKFQCSSGQTEVMHTVEVIAKSSHSLLWSETPSMENTHAWILNWNY